MPYRQTSAKGFIHPHAEDALRALLSETAFYGGECDAAKHR